MSPSAPTKQVALFLGGAAVPAALTKQTVHPQNKLIRGHGIPPCPLCVATPPTDASIGGYGILPYPRRPPRGCSGLRCNNPSNRAPTL